MLINVATNLKSKIVVLMEEIIKIMMKKYGIIKEVNWQIRTLKKNHFTSALITATKD